jgi:uncharacterized protein YjiS (DUF1127 family)
MSNRNYAARSGAIAFAFVRTSPPRPGIRGALGRIAAFFTAQAEARARSRQARESVRRLMSLSNRELRDIGISRSEILFAVYGPVANASGSSAAANPKFSTPSSTPASTLR